MEQVRGQEEQAGSREAAWGCEAQRRGYGQGRCGNSAWCGGDRSGCDGPSLSYTDV